MIIPQATFQLMIEMFKQIDLFGRIRASEIMKRIDGKSKKSGDEANKFKRNIFKTCKILQNCYPEEINILERVVEDSIGEACERGEVLIEKDFRPLNAFFDREALVNLTSERIPEDIGMFLAFGPRFTVPQTVCVNNFINIMTETSVCYERNLPVVTRNEAFKQTKIQLHSYAKSLMIDQDKWLLFVQHRTREFFKKNDDMLVIRSDKGKHTVVLPKQMYIDKMIQHISSTSDYTAIDDVNIAALENTNNTFVDELVLLGAITDGSKYRDYCTTTSNMYGLIKIHKSNYPIRPITSACGAPGFKLSKFLTWILTEVFNEQGHHVKNSLVLKNKLKDIHVQHDETLVSFDVVSMFTNITTEVMLQIIEERRHIITNKFKVPWPLFVEIFQFLLKDCAIFTFNGTTYKQNDSLAMGSPISPILAKILMSKILDFVLIKYGTMPKLIGLYVDDSIWLLKKSDVNTILELLNSFHHRIKFTMELEKDGAINFLDIRLIRSDNQLITCWYKKHFASLRILNFFSNHSRTCIVQTAISFVKMVLNLSDGEFFMTNKKVLTQMLHANSFPEELVIRILHNHYTLMRPPTNSIKGGSRYAPIPFHKNFSSNLKVRMLSLHPGYRLTPIPDRSTTRHFSYIKDKIDVKNKTNMILTLECQCKKYVDIRHTEFRRRAEELIDFCSSTFDVSQGKCGRLNHKMNRWNWERCKNYPIMIAKFNILIHINKDRLQYATDSLTHIKYKQALDSFIFKL